MKKYNLAIGNRFGIHHTGIVEAENMKDARLKAMRIRTDEGISGWIRLKYVRELSGWQEGFLDGQSYPFEETARKIWDAGVEYGQFSIHGGSPAPPDFETFYKQLIEGK